MYFKSADIVPWDNFIPFFLEAINLDDNDKNIIGLNDNVVIVNTRSLASEFIRRTQVLQDRIFIDGQCNVSEYTFYEQGDYDVNAIILLMAGNQSLKKSSYLYDGSPVPYGQYNELPNNTLIISNPPMCDVKNYISIWCSYSMSSQACGIPKPIFEKWGRRIACGAVAHCFKMGLIRGDSTRSSIRLAKELELDYGRAVSEAISEAKGLLGGGVPLQPDTGLDGFLNAGGLNNGYF